MNENVELAKSVFLNADKTNMNTVDSIKSLLVKLRDRKIFFKSIASEEGYTNERFRSPVEILKILVRYGCKFYDYNKFIASREIEAGEFLWSSEIYYEKLLKEDLSSLDFFDIKKYYTTKIFMSSQFTPVFYEWALACGGNLFLIKMEKRIPYSKPSLDSSMSINEIVGLFKKTLENSGITIKIASKNSLISNSKSFNYDDLIKSTAFQYMLSGFTMNLANIKQIELTDKIQEWLGTLTPPNEISTDGVSPTSIISITNQLANNVRDLEVVAQQIAQVPPPSFDSGQAALAQQLSLASQKAELEKSIASLSSELSAINPAIVKNSEFDTFIASITAILRKIDDINIKINKEGSSTELTSQRNIYRQQASDMIAKLSGAISYDATVNELKLQISDLQAKLDGEKSNSNSLSSKLLLSSTEYEKQVADSKAKIDLLNAEIEKKNSQLIAVNSIGNQVTANNSELERKYNDILKSKTELESLVEKSKMETLSLNTEIENLKNKIKENEAALLAPLNSSLASALENTQELDKNKQLLLVEINKYSLKLEAEEKKRKDYEFEILKRNREIESYKNDLALKNSVIAALAEDKRVMMNILSQIGYRNMGEGYSLPVLKQEDNYGTAGMLLTKLYFILSLYPTTNNDDIRFLNGLHRLPFTGDVNYDRLPFSSIVRWTGKFTGDTFYYNELRLLCSQAGDDPVRIAKVIENLTAELKGLISACFGSTSVKAYLENGYNGTDKYLFWAVNSNGAPIMIIDKFKFRTREEWINSTSGLEVLPVKTLSTGERVNILAAIKKWISLNPTYKSLFEFKDKIPLTYGKYKNKFTELFPEAELILDYFWDHHDQTLVRIDMYNNYFISVWNLRKGMANKLMTLYKPEIEIQNLSPETSNIRVALAGFQWIHVLISELKQLSNYAYQAKLDADRVNNELQIAAAIELKNQQLTSARNPYATKTDNFRNVKIGTNYPTITPEILATLIDLEEHLVSFSTLSESFGNIRVIKAYTIQEMAIKGFKNKFYTPKFMDNKLNMLIVYNDEINAGNSGLKYFDENKFMTFFINALSRRRVCFSLVIPTYNIDLSKNIHMVILKYNPNVSFASFDTEFSTKGLYLGKYITNTQSAFELLNAMLGFYFYDETAWIQIARTNPEKYTVTPDSMYEWGNHLTSFHYMHMETLRVMFRPTLGFNILTNYDAWINTQQIYYDQFAIAYYMKLFARDFRWVSLSPIGDMTYPIFAKPASKMVMVEDLIDSFHTKTMKYMGVYIASRNTWEIDTSDSLEVFINPLEQLYSILYYIKLQDRTHEYFKGLTNELERDHFYYGCIRATAPFRRLKMSWWTTDGSDCGYDGSPYTPITSDDYLVIMEHWERLTEEKKAEYRGSNKLAQLLGRSSKYIDVVRQILRGATKITVNFPWNPSYIQMGLVGLLPLLLTQTIETNSTDIVNVIKESGQTHLCLFAPEVSMAFTSFLEQYAGDYAELFLYTLTIVGSAPLCNGNLCDCLDRGGLMALASTQGDSTNRCKQGVKAYCYIPKYRTQQFDAMMKEYAKTCESVTVQTALHSLEMQKIAANLAKEAVMVGLKAIAA